MANHTSKIMSGVRRRLTRLVNLHLKACGRENEVQIALRAEDQLIGFIEQELHALQERIDYATQSPFSRP